ncbi:mechanosensitive ion channel domain-containing protein [Colwellia sp. E2M01]|uniref:mechanosensitive ion channel family protein n=1 Tax=Colwellia sp. E2M01 TaxID=2841561 RepID=UPI001C09DB57|nr:mechanosensitive ion channel domain-containing protein [Colwellia sp. E2M01]MBU2870750.1 mechanosensitive ion channel family protein [Colwellia sp. E2M01]
MKSTPLLISLTHTIIIAILFLTSLFYPSVYATNSKPTGDGSGVSIKEMIETKDTAVKSAEVDSSLDEINTIEDEYERGQPRSAVTGYLRAARTGDWTLATHYLDYRNISDTTLSVGKEELARQLAVVLNRTVWIDLTGLSTQPEGRANDNLPSYREAIGQVEYEERTIDILLQRVPRSTDRVKIWKISNATVEKVPDLFKRYSYTPLGEYLAKELPAVDFYGIMLWQWLYFSLMMLVYFIVAKILTWGFSIGLNHLHKNISVDVLKFIKGPVALVLAVILARNFSAEANVTVALRAVTEGSTLLIIACCWLLFSFIDLMKIILAKKFIAQDKPLAVYLLRPAGTVIKIVIFILAGLYWLENLGFDASTLLAGLGIGGLALALAAQKTVENLIGAITLYTSAPIRIGDFCRFGDSLGVVEEIGLRATRIRTIDRTVIYIANSKFIDMNIENYSEREKLSFKPKILLAPNTPKENVDSLLHAIKELLTNTEIIDEAPRRTHFKDYTIYGLELDIMAYVNTTNFDLYLDTINQINLDILALLAEHNCKLQVMSDRLIK